MPESEKLIDVLPAKLGGYYKNLVREGVPETLAGQIVMDAATRIHTDAIGRSN